MRARYKRFFSSVREFGYKSNLISPILPHAIWVLFAGVSINQAGNCRYALAAHQAISDAPCDSFLEHGRKVCVSIVRTDRSEWSI